MYKKGSGWIVVSVFLTLIIVGEMFYYVAVGGPKYDSAYREQEILGNIRNPLTGLSIGDAQNEFDERSVRYLLYSLKAYNLHNLPQSSDAPEIEVIVGGEEYHATIVSGSIYVKKEKVEKKDIVIRTTLSEAIKMVQNPETIKESFQFGRTSMELVSDGNTLLYKGYYAMTSELRGKGFTGNVIGEYFS